MLILSSYLLKYRYLKRTFENTVQANWVQVGQVVRVSVFKTVAWVWFWVKSYQYLKNGIHRFSAWHSIWKNSVKIKPERLHCVTGRRHIAGIPPFCLQDGQQLDSKTESLLHCLLAKTTWQIKNRIFCCLDYEVFDKMQQFKDLLKLIQIHKLHCSKDVFGFTYMPFINNA